MKCKRCGATEGIFRDGYCLNCIAVRLERLEDFIRRAYNAGSDHDTMNALAEAVAYLEGKDEHA